MLKKLLIIVGFTSLMSFARLMFFVVAVLVTWQGVPGGKSTSAAPAAAAPPKVVHLTEQTSQACATALDAIDAEEQAGIKVYRPKTTDERLAVARHNVCNEQN